MSDSQRIYIYIYSNSSSFWVEPYELLPLLQYKNLDDEILDHLTCTKHCRYWNVPRLWWYERSPFTWPTCAPKRKRLTRSQHGSCLGSCENDAFLTQDSLYQRGGHNYIVGEQAPNKGMSQLQGGPKRAWKGHTPQSEFLEQIGHH